MDIKTFSKNKKVLKSTVIKWIERGYIPGASIAEDYIPDSARVPFTGARAKKADSIYFSMVKATNERKHILPVLYNMQDDEFYGFIDRLVEAGYITRRESDGVTYYDATLKAKDIKREKMIETIKLISKEATTVAASVATTALMNRLGR